MISAIISFFGGNAFRLLFGEVSAWLNKKQDHQFEIERLKLQAEQDAAQHERAMASIQQQHEMGVDIIRVQGDADMTKIDADIFGRAVDMTGKTTGIYVVDLWNGIIRPLLATECMILWSLHLARHNWTLDEQGWALVGAALGIFVADRTLMKRGK